MTQNSSHFLQICPISKALECPISSKGPQDRILMHGIFPKAKPDCDTIQFSSLCDHDNHITRDPSREMKERH